LLLARNVNIRDEPGNVYMVVDCNEAGEEHGA